MPTMLRITFDQKDFIIRVITDKPSLQRRLEVVYGQHHLFFTQQGHAWMVEEIPADAKLRQEVAAIEKALALRYRINAALQV